MVKINLNSSVTYEGVAYHEGVHEVSDEIADLVNKRRFGVILETEPEEDKEPEAPKKKGK